MNRKALKYLWDIKDCIEHIQTYIQETKTLESFIQNSLVQDAVERRLIILGEATKRLQQMGVSLSYSDSSINRRNTIIHQYDDFSAKSIWRHIQEDLPGLLKEVHEHFTALE